MGIQPIYYLFICCFNIDRSPTAEAVYEKMAKKKNLEIRVSSAGLEDSDNPVTKEMADKADKIFVMEDYMKRKLIENYHQDPQKIINLNVPNETPEDPLELRRIFESKLKKYLPG